MNTTIQFLYPDGTTVNAAPVLPFRRTCDMMRSEGWTMVWSAFGHAEFTDASGVTAKVKGS